MISLLFGDVFRYNEKMYVFLGQTEEITYTAQILDKSISHQVDNLFQKKYAGNKLPKVKDNLLYCYVMLKTQELKDQLAHFANTGKDSFSLTIDKLAIELCLEDKKQILEEILSNDPIPMELKELVKGIKI